MTKEELVHLIARQLDEILSQAERIINGTCDMETLKNFSQYSKELTTFLKNNVTNPMILERLEKIPLIDLDNYKSSFLSTIFSIRLASTATFGDKVNFQKAIEDIKIAQGYYSSIQFLFKNEF